jgi:hypothetical protein
MRVTYFQSRLGMLKLFRNRTFAFGMVAVMLSFMGQFALFTYLRPLVAFAAEQVHSRQQGPDINFDASAMCSTCSVVK